MSNLNHFTGGQGGGLSYAMDLIDYNLGVPSNPNITGINVTGLNLTGVNGGNFRDYNSQGTNIDSVPQSTKSKKCNQSQPKLRKKGTKKIHHRKQAS